MNRNNSSSSSNIREMWLRGENGGGGGGGGTSSHNPSWWEAWIPRGRGGGGGERGGGRLSPLSRLHSERSFGKSGYLRDANAIKDYRRKSQMVISHTTLDRKNTGKEGWNPTRFGPGGVRRIGGIKGFCLTLERNRYVFFFWSR